MKLPKAKFLVVFMFLCLFILSCGDTLQHESKTDSDVVVDDLFDDYMNDEELIDIDSVADKDAFVVIDEDEIVVADEDAATPDDDAVVVTDEDEIIDEESETPDSDILPEIGSMVTIPGNTFWQGCRTGVNGSIPDENCSNNESPYHQVTVPSFKIDVYEVTNSHYIQFLNAHGNVCFPSDVCVRPEPARFKLSESTGVWSVDTGFENFPISGVSWYGAKAYCQWVGKRLPTESEWEFAARGTDERIYPWGDESLSCDYAQYCFCGSGAEEIAVGSKPLGMSPYGLFNMAGNVQEWVEDDWHDDYNVAGKPDDGSAWIDEPRGNYRVARGYSTQNWLYGSFFRTSSRFKILHNGDLIYKGFRCASE